MDLVVEGDINNNKKNDEDEDGQLQKGGGSWTNSLADGVEDGLADAGNQQIASKKILSVTDIIAKNMAENKAFLSQLLGNSKSTISLDDEKAVEYEYNRHKHKRKFSKEQIIEIRRNPGRKARSYAGDENTSDETTITRMPLKVKFSLGKWGLKSEGAGDVSEDYNYESDAEEDDDRWDKSPLKKRVRLSTPLTGVRKASEITKSELDRVILDPRIKKKYTGSHLTTCHQCRQKTDDMKTICRSGFCRGVLGQFCGICLYNRYGENVKEALLDDKWSCPVCRNVCNCSFCLPKKGKSCTGILVPIARKHGFTNVKSFLDSLSDGKKCSVNMEVPDDTSNGGSVRAHSEFCDEVEIKKEALDGENDDVKLKENRANLDFLSS
ncbi:hypothetical protein HELRODRAFT_189004 [Helobdella robusta]|uniref:Zinc-finger domain-containing protein n=1 Tax=Helobdella robusta TaxID=6412 RepID=T1FQJ9_HELRO|nr:hypothetical protein HELRODRAFT_189004 [Helobdella robusta]ESN99142.1 hypothetical protein HELRODRAFT_189004 [Helobdella robusta]